MRIAFLSYEYPLSHTGGGIGTYVGAAAAMLHAHGHSVEVFTGAPSGTTLHTKDHHGVTVHFVPATDRFGFPASVAVPFAGRHQQQPFDVLEGPEYNADAFHAVRAVPSIPLVVKLHTPSFLVSQLNNSFVSLPEKMRFLAGGLRRGRLARPFWHYDKRRDLEFLHIRDADLVASPSEEFGRLVARKWQVAQNTVVSFPLPYTPGQEILKVPAERQPDTVFFIGKLEMRKGAHLFRHIVPQVLAKHPGTRFVFIGENLPSPVRDLDMMAYLLRELHPYRANLEFVGKVPAADIPHWLSRAGVCVFPSLFESFGYVCLEAMAAARAVVASSRGGMKDMLAGGRCGLPADPADPASFARAITALLADPARRAVMGAEARARILAEYSPETIVGHQLECYREAIRLRQQRGPRVFPQPFPTTDAA